MAERIQRCKTCNETKGISEYHWRKDTKSNGGYRYVCKICACNKAKESYQRNKEKCKARCAKAAKARILERRKFVYNYLKERSCVQCGESDVRCLDFDHVDSKDKDLAISRAIWNNWSMNRLINEINKCQILCANCHRKKTSDQMGWYDFADQDKEERQQKASALSFENDKKPLFTREELLKEHLKHGKEYVEKEYLSTVRSAVKEFVSKNGWFYPPVKQSLNEAVDKIAEKSRFDSGLQDFSTMSSEGTGFLKSTFRSYWNTKGGPVDSFHDDKTLDRVLKYRLGINNSKQYKYKLDGKEILHNEVFDITLSNIRRGFVVQRRAVSFFKPRVACEIYGQYLQNVDNPIVYDPSCGFGARMLGFYSFLQAFNKSGTYIGTEPAKQTYSDLCSLNAKMDSDTMLAMIHNIGSEELDTGNSSYVDLVFTSPPYFDKEKYFDEDTQCWKKYPDLSTWKQKYLLPTFKNAHHMLKSGGHMVINIGGYLKNAVLECALNAGFSFEEEKRLILRKDHFSKDGKNDLRFEPILVFKKD